MQWKKGARLLVGLFVFIRDIRGSRTSEQDGRKAWFGYR